MSVAHSASGQGAEILAGKSLSFHYRQDIAPAGSGYRVHQILTGMELPDSLGAAARAGLEQATAFSRDTVYDADASLTPVRIVGWQDQVAAIIQMMTKLLGPTADKRAIEAVRQQFSGLTPEQASSMLKEQNMVAVVQGLALDLNVPIAADVQMSNPLGGGAIKGKVSFVLESLDTAGHNATIHMHQELDPESLSRTTRQVVAALAAGMPSGKPKPTQADLAALKIENTLDCRGQVDTVTGLARTVTCVSTVTGADKSLKPSTRIDRWVITQGLVN